MTSRLSAGILLFRRSRGMLEVLIGHPGGPFWANKQEGAWSIPKGLVEDGEDVIEAAQREFEEETSFPLPHPEMIDLGAITQRSGKIVAAWAVEGDIDEVAAQSNPVQIEWPRGSGRVIEFPEIDEFRWCTVAEAEHLLNSAQIPLLIRLNKWLDHGA